MGVFRRTQLIPMLCRHIASTAEVREFLSSLAVCNLRNISVIGSALLLLGFVEWAFVAVRFCHVWFGQVGFCRME